MANVLFRVRNAASTSVSCMHFSKDLHRRLLSDSCPADRLPLWLLAIAVARASVARPGEALLSYPSRPSRRGPPLVDEKPECGPRAKAFCRGLSACLPRCASQAQPMPFDLGHKAATNHFLFLLPSGRATQDMGLFAAWNQDLLHRHFPTDLFEIILEQFLFELLELAACLAHQILSATLTDGHQVLLTRHPAIKDPHPPCFPVLALHGAQDRFHRGDIGAVPIE